MALITSEAFSDALTDGDLETLQAYFSQPNVRSIVEETEVRIVDLVQNGRNMTQIGQTLTLRDGVLPWFRGSRDNPVWLVSSACRGHVDAIEWFFSQENARRMGATLTVLLPLVAVFRDRNYSRNPSAHAHDPLVLEALLASHVFSERFTDEQKQRVLDSITSQTDSRPVLEVAIVHGARLNTPASVLASYGIDALSTNASFLLSVDVLLAPSCLWGWAVDNDSFLTADPVDFVVGFHITVGKLDYLKCEAALNEGFLDVDAHGVDGMTPLMNFVDLNSQGHDQNVAVDLAELLLRCGTDVNAKDRCGRSALHHAREQGGMTKLLLECGADPTIPDVYGVTAFDWIVEKVYEWREWQEVVKLCLERSVDPYERRPRPEWRWGIQGASSPAQPERSLFDRLHERDAGKAFMVTHRQFFERDGGGLGSS